MSNFWIQNVKTLFSSVQVVPLHTMSLSEQLNAITRLIIIIFIIMLMFNFRYSIYFLILSLVFIIIIYYIQKRTMQRSKENFVIQMPEPLFFCNDSVPSAIGMNQNLTERTVNPKTLINPVIKPRSHDLDYWRESNLVTHSAINAESHNDMYLSGYASRDDTVEQYTPGAIISPKPVDSIETYKAPYGAIISPKPVVNTPYIPSLEHYEPRENNPGWVNTACGYNHEQLSKAGLPTNLPTGRCSQDPMLKQYNTNLHTQIITPGVYTKNDLNESINSNLGISFQQQFGPTTSTHTDKGLHYTQHDPRIIEPPVYEPEEESARYDNVYDPRFYGYGTSYRSYIEPVTGQPRFMYDDINAIRMPNYITRNKVDHLPYADSYGTMQEDSDIRDRVQNSWLEDSLKFRNDLSERRMRKVNSEMWQRRQAPKHTY